MHPAKDGAHAESIGRRLRRLRLERGLSQRDLSERGVSYAYISRIEAGSRRPSVKALRMLARKLGVSAEYLETGSDLREVDARELRLADAELELRLADDPGAAEAKLRELLVEAGAAGDSGSAVRAHVGLGIAAARRGDHARAVTELEEALRSSPPSPCARPDVYATLGRSYVALGKPERAVELFERCLEQVAEEAADGVAVRVRFATYLSFALSDAGELERAHAVLRDALAEAEQLTDPYTRIRLYWALGRVAVDERRPGEALSYIRRAIAFLETTEDTLDLARAHVLYAWTLTTHGQAREAGAHLELAERLFGPRADASDIGSLRIEQAKRAARLGDAEEAISRARQALDLLEPSESAEAGEAWWALGEALGVQGDVDGANDAFGRAVELLERHGQRRDCADAYRAWGKLLRNAGREREALDILERAADLAVHGPSKARA